MAEAPVFFGCGTIRDRHGFECRALDGRNVPVRLRDLIDGRLEKRPQPGNPTHALFRLGAEGGEAAVSRTGHALVKETMRNADAVYGGEMSGHHYFRDFMYCDSGMVPWLLVVYHMSVTGHPLSELVGDMRARHPSSGERTFRLADPDAAIAAVEAEFATSGTIDRLDGLSVEFDRWRFNLRKSNTEAAVRLNAESRADPALLEDRVRAIIDRLEDFA